MTMDRPSRTKSRVSLLLIVIVASIVGMGAWQVVESRRSLRTHTLEANIGTARVTAHALDDAILSRIRVIQTFTARPELSEVLAARDWEQARTMMDFFPVVLPEYTHAALLDADGIVRGGPLFDARVDGADHSGTPYFTAAMATAEPIVTDGFRAAGTSRASFGIVARISDEAGSPLGVLALVLPVDALGFGRTGVVPNGGSIAVFDTLGARLSAPEEDPADERANAIRTAIEGEATGAGEYMVPGRDGVRLTAWTRVPSVGWTVVVEQSRAAFAPVTALTGRMLIILVLTALGAILAAVAIQRALRRVDRERSRAAAILASMGDGAIVCDPRARVVSINAAMSALAGLSADVARGRPLADVLRFIDERGESDAPVAEMVDEAIAGRRPVSSAGKVLSVRDQAGGTTPVSVTVGPIDDELSDGLVGAVVIVRDVAHERAVDELKDSLISTVSHELRTPLTMIQGFSELLIERPDLDAKRVEVGLEQIKASADRLGRLIDDLLSVSSIETGYLPVERVPVRLQAVMDAVVTPLALLHDRSVSVTVHEPEPIAMADRDKVERVLTNLVTNAFKYSPADRDVR